jgi:hypothetical protein
MLVTWNNSPTPGTVLSPSNTFHFSTTHFNIIIIYDQVLSDVISVTKYNHVQKPGVLRDMFQNKISFKTLSVV